MMKIGHIDNEISRSKARIVSAKSGATQILKSIASWSETEMPKGRNRKMKILEKILKQIREPKYGVSLRALGLVFCRDSCPRELSFDMADTVEFTYESMKTARGLVRRLRKSQPEGLNIAIFKYKDQVLGITEYRYVNTFWNDSLTEADRLNQIEHATKCLAGLEKKQERLQYIIEHPDEVQSAVDKLEAEIEDTISRDEQREKKQHNSKVVDDGKNSSMDEWLDRC
jgi:hypothetical protein